MNSEAHTGKLKDAMRGGGSAASKYFAITYGPMPRWKAVCMELATLCLSGIPGALGLFLRGRLYRPFFAAFGRNVAIGANSVTGTIASTGTKCESATNPSACAAATNAS